jgi:hypothetical protein
MKLFKRLAGQMMTASKTPKELARDMKKSVLKASPDNKKYGRKKKI